MRILVLLIVCSIQTFVYASIKPHVKLSGIWAYGDTVTNSNILETEQNNLRFYCTTIEKIPVDSLEFEFLLEGYTTKWEEAFLGGWFYYTNLVPGDYIFYARCRYKGGEWGPICQHAFSIDCPWWLTKWAYALYFILSFTVVSSLFYLIRSKIKLHNQLKVEQAISQFRYDFVIQASRKLRTPLTIIRSTIEKLTSLQESHLTRTDIQHLRNSNRQLIQMIENLLEYRSIGESEPMPSVSDVIEMADVPLNNRLAFIIEPDEMLADIIRRELLKYIQVKLYSEGEDVVDEVRKIVPDLVIIDADLTDMSAYTLLNEIKSVMHLPVVLVSDFDDKKSLIRAIHSKADDYLAKPFNCEVLAALVIKHIRIYDSQKAKNEGMLTGEESKKVQGAVAIPLVEKRADKRFLELLDLTIMDNMFDAHFDVNSLAEKMKISRSQLGNKIKKLRGMTSVEYLRDSRLTYAAQLLLNEDITVQEIMYKVGMQDPTNFYRRFKDKYGMSPVAYRQYHV